MPISHNRVQTYINDVITLKTQPYAFIGTTDKDLSADSVESQLNVWTDSLFVYRITKKDIAGVVPNNTYQQSTVYVPWSSASLNSGLYYAYNKLSGIVYLCLSDNSLNRTDLRSQSASTKPPSHGTGAETYPDGYTWLALYRITAPLLKFVTADWIPVISLGEYLAEFNGTAYDRMIRFGTVPGATGYCGVYVKQNTEIPLTSSTNDTYKSGALFSTLSNVTCKDCFWLFQNNPVYTSKFSGNTVPASTVTVLDAFDTIEDLVSRNILSSSSPYYHLYQMAKNGLEDGAIISCFIDLSDLTLAQLTITEANPIITTTSSAGKDAVLRFSTYPTSSGYVINGITVSARGSGYSDINLSVLESVFPNISTSTLLSRIVVNLDFVDSLHIDPVRSLNCTTTSTLVRISTDDLVSNDIDVPANINFYGLVENPKRTDDDDNIVDINKTGNNNTSYLIGNTTEFTVSVDENSAAVEEFEAITSSTPIFLSNTANTGKQQNTKVVPKNIPIPIVMNAGYNYYTISLNGVNTSNISEYSVMSLLGVTGPSGTVESMTPSSIVYNAGIVTKVAKITGLNLSDTESSKLFSLNSIDHRQ